MRNVIYIALSAASIGLLIVEGPRGELLTSTPAPAEVTRDKSGRTVRGIAPLFVWSGGGYQGGK